MELTKTKAKELLRDDYIPGGKPVKITDLKFRRATESEIVRCCRSTERDPQSGSYYCGDTAEYVAFTEDGYMALCERCGRNIKCAE